MDYILLIIAAALGAIGVFSGLDNKALTRTNKAVLVLIVLSLAFGVGQTYSKNTKDAQEKRTRADETASLRKQLTDAKEETKHAEDLLLRQSETRAAEATGLKNQLAQAREESTKAQTLLSQQSKINLFAVLSNAPPIRKYYFSALNFSKTYPLKAGGMDPLTTLLGSNQALRNTFVEARLNVRMTVYTTGLNIRILPNGPLLSSGRAELESDGVKYTVELRDRLDVSAESSAKGFGNAAIVLRDLDRLEIASLTVTFRTPPSSISLNALQRHWDTFFGGGSGAIELLDSSSLAVNVKAPLQRLKVSGTHVTAGWKTVAPPELYLMAM